MVSSQVTISDAGLSPHLVALGNTLQVACRAAAPEGALLPPPWDLPSRPADETEAEAGRSPQLIAGASRPMAVKAAGQAPARAKATGADWRLLSVAAVVYGVLVSDPMRWMACSRPQLARFAAATAACRLLPKWLLHPAAWPYAAGHHAALPGGGAAATVSGCRRYPVL